MEIKSDYRPINADGFWHRPSAQTGFTGYDDLPAAPKETFTPSQPAEPKPTYWHKQSEERGYEGYA